ncbi:TolC family outer membrane protein [Ramlibacter sp.]|uniref:TolC family outer membrane protein n=1 Tax=Ramlibacter sp. TaxID=1917967 RepID=UPI002D6C52B7|nr:TolC family outer membrane protein [Ramlibacter sp.]HYD75383.1 TolC family outer membrane protein [Ramlibacter sp.]
MGLAELFRQARPQEARLQAAEAAWRAGQEQVPQALSQLRPQVTLTAARLKNDLESTNPGFLGPVTSRDRYMSENQTLTLRQPLYRPAQWAALKAARHGEQAARAQLEAEFPAFGAKVGSAYFEVVLAEGQVRFAGELVKALELQLAAARRSFEAGAGTRTDIDEVQAQLDSALADQVEAVQARASAAQQLQVLLGGRSAQLEPVRLRPEAVWGKADEPLAAWQARARQASAEIRMLQAQADAAREDIAKAEAGHKPTLDLLLQRSRSGSENVTRIDSRFDNTSFGLQLNVPIYSGGAVSSQVRQAVAEAERANHLLQVARDELDSRVRQEHRGVIESLARLRALEQAVASASTALRSAERSFDAGVRSRVDIALAAQRLARQQRELLQASNNVLLSRLRLELLTAGDEPQVEAAMRWMDQAVRLER